MSAGPTDADPAAVDPAADPAAADPTADPTAVLAAYWSESERRLYPTATTNPDAYKSALRLVRAVADALADVADLDELARRWELRSATLDEAAKSVGQVVAHGPADETAGAGFLLRRRELLAGLAERRRGERIAAARRAGRDWAVVHEQGSLDSGLADPYQCVELHLPTGLAVVSMVEPDPSTMSPVYVVAVTAMGGGGRALAADAASFGDLETGDPQQFENHRQEMRGRVSGAGV